MVLVNIIIMRNYRIVNRSFGKDTEKIQTERKFDGYGSGVGFTRSRFESLFSIPASGGEDNGKNGNRHDQGCSRAAAVELPRRSPDEPEQADDDQKSKHSHTSFLIFEYKKTPCNPFDCRVLFVEQISFHECTLNFNLLSSPVYSIVMSIRARL